MDRLKEAPAQVGAWFSAPWAQRLFSILFWGVVAYAVAGPLVLRLVAPMIMKHDNIFFLPASFAIRNDLGFNNHWANPINSGAFDWHGVVHPALIALLAPTSGWWGVNAGAVIIAAMGIGVYLAMLRAAQTLPVIRVLGAVIVVASFMSFAGRPETTAGLILGLLIVLNWPRLFEPPKPVRLVGSGALLGVLGATHPLVLIITSFLYAGLRAAAAVRRGRRPLGYIKEMVATAVIAAGVLVVAVAVIYPYDAVEYAQGMWAHATHATARLGQGPFVTYFVLTKHLPFLVLSFVPLAFVLVQVGRRHWGQASWFFKLVMGVALAGFLAALYRYPISIPVTYYNYSVFLPALAVGFAVLLGRRVWSWRALGATAALAAFAGLCALAQGFWVYQTVAGVGVRGPQAQAIGQLVTAELEAGHRVAVDSPLIVALEDPEVVFRTAILFYGRLIDGGKAKPDPAVFDIVLRAQAEFDAPAPPIPGFTLETDAFLEGYGGLAFANPEHLGYAVYRPTREGRGSGGVD